MKGLPHGYGCSGAGRAIGPCFFGMSPCIHDRQCRGVERSLERWCTGQHTTDGGGGIDHAFMHHIGKIEYF